jgi:predicted AAA+ superfamily ATPase
MHLVNDVKRLDKASFIKSLVTNTIKASTTLLPILRRSTRTFKRLLNGIKGKKVDFILFNIAIIKGFLINIVLKALFYEKGL